MQYKNTISLGAAVFMMEQLPLDVGCLILSYISANVRLRQAGLVCKLWWYLAWHSLCRYGFAIFPQHLAEINLFFTYHPKFVPQDLGLYAETMPTSFSSFPQQSILQSLVSLRISAPAENVDWSRLSQCTRLWDLRIAICTIDMFCGASLANCTFLHNLELESIKYTYNGMLALLPIATTIRRLTFYSLPRTILPLLTHLENLTKLKFGKYDSGEPSVSLCSWQALSRLTRLQSLEVPCDFAGSESDWITNLRLLRYYKGKPSALPYGLPLLNNVATFWSTNLPVEVGKLPIDYARLRNLTRLSLYDCCPKFGDPSEHIATLARELTGLRSLQFRGEGRSPVRDLTPLTSLTALNALDVRCKPCNYYLPPLPALTRLFVRKFPPPTLATSLTGLRVLTVQHGAVSDVELATIPSLSRLESLTIKIAGYPTKFDRLRECADRLTSLTLLAPFSTYEWATWIECLSSLTRLYALNVKEWAFVQDIQWITTLSRLAYITTDPGADGSVIIGRDQAAPLAQLPELRAVYLGRHCYRWYDIRHLTDFHAKRRKYDDDAELYGIDE
jgi:hypothetical protein